MMNQSVTIDVTNAREQTQTVETASSLKIWQRRLTILLVLQVLLMIGVFAYQQNSREQVNSQPLLGIKTTDVDRLVIQDANNKVTLQKTGDEWQLPELHQLPVDRQKLDEILQKLDGTTLTWPVTNTASSHERFEVAGTKFQRRLELFHGDSKKADIWLGTSPGFKKNHLRREGEDQVYAVELTAFEFAVEAKDWLQKDLLAVKDPSMIKAADYEIRKTDNSWSFVAANQDASADKVNATKATQLTTAFSNLQVQEVAAQVPQGETTKTILKSAAGEFEYEFIEADNEYFVKRNDRDMYFKFSQAEFERITTIIKATLTDNESDQAIAPPNPVSDLTSLESVLKQ